MSFLFKKQINHEYANEPYEVAYITNFEDSDGDTSFICKTSMEAPTVMMALVPICCH